MSDPPDTPVRARGNRIPPDLQVVPVTRRATRTTLRAFDRLTVTTDRRQVIAVTKDQAFAESFKSYRAYTRDSRTGVREYEVTFDEHSVSNALWVLAHA
jgi:hypothetical protein